MNICISLNPKINRWLIAWMLLIIAGTWPVNAQTTNVSTSTGNGPDEFVQVINQVGQQGLNLLRAILFIFLMIYAVLLGIAVSFGQAGSQEITSFIIGTIFIAGAQLIAGIYLTVIN